MQKTLLVVLLCLPLSTACNDDGGPGADGAGGGDDGAGTVGSCADWGRYLDAHPLGYKAVHERETIILNGDEEVSAGVTVMTTEIIESSSRRVVSRFTSDDGFNLSTEDSETTPDEIAEACRRFGSIPPMTGVSEGFDNNTTIAGIETITVRAGTFETDRIEVDFTLDGSGITGMGTTWIYRGGPTSNLVVSEDLTQTGGGLGPGMGTRLLMELIEFDPGR
ncbi:MAG: hypothetical protein AAGN82_09460 [Myxococcota bacterium]